jgi:hypothetical protein
MAPMRLESLTTKRTGNRRRFPRRRSTAAASPPRVRHSSHWLFGAGSDPSYVRIDCGGRLGF